MFSKKQIVVLVILLGVGLALALELLHIDYMVNYSNEPFKSFCNIDERFNCDAVAASSYSHLFGVPIAFIGSSSNFLLLAFLFIGWHLEHIRRRMKQIYVAIFALYAIGCAALAAVSFLLVPALCIVCMAYWGTSIATFVYLVAISGGAWKRPGELVLEVFRGVLRHQAAVSVLLVLFVSANAYAGYRFSYCGCNKKGTQPLECEGFESSTQTAYLGRETAKIDVVIYTDFQCPWCKRAHYALMDMIKQYEKQVRFVRKDFPLDMACNRLVQQPFHAVACRAAFWAKCAGQQGKYWEFHDELYRNQEILSEEIFENIAKMLSLDVKSLRECAASDAVRASVEREIAEAVQYRVNATPSFRIFGELLTGMVNEQILNDYLAFYPAIKADVVRRIVSGKPASPVQIIDVRDPSEFEKGHIDRATNIPLAALRTPSSTAALQADAPTLLYDQSGKEIGEAFDIVKSRGFVSIHTLLGGYKSWNEKASQLAEGARWITPGEALAMIDSDAKVIVDLRTRDQYRASHIQGAKHIPIEELESRLGELAPYKDEKVLLYCRTNNKTIEAVRLLRGQGFSQLFAIEGGSEAWGNEGLPLTQ